VLFPTHFFTIFKAKNKKQTTSITAFEKAKANIHMASSVQQGKKILYSKA